MKKNYIFILSLLVIVSGCCRKKRDTCCKPVADKKIVHEHECPCGHDHEPVRRVETAEFDVPLASDELRSYFDDSGVGLEQFELVEDSSDTSDGDQNTNNNDEVAQLDKFGDFINLDDEDFDDFQWASDIENATVEYQDGTFKKCYFDFDRYDVSDDQEENIEVDIELAKRAIDEDEDSTVVIEGHACHAKGSRVYNLALSEKRAKSVADRFVAAGVPSDRLKVVPRGQECPAKDESGKDITGSVQEQWANRRSEVRVVYS
ncbi:OmpA family protein [Candidatus Dependentiae bacterium]